MIFVFHLVLFIYLSECVWTTKTTGRPLFPTTTKKQAQERYSCKCFDTYSRETKRKKNQLDGLV